MEAELGKFINKAKDRIDLYKAPLRAVEELYKNPCSGRACNRNLNVAVVAAPCHGFGDVVFAAKFARYLKKGLTPRGPAFSSKVTIVTPAPDMFKKLGVTDVKIVPLKGGSKQCRRLSGYSRPAKLPTFDLIFVAPLQQDFQISYPDVKKLFKESNPFNTFILSEYQDSPDKGFDFTTGVGAKFYGLFFDGTRPATKLSVLGRQPYAFGYLAKDVGPKNCLVNFSKLVIQKYNKKHKNLQLVVPDWAADELSKNKSFIKFASKFYPKVVLKTKNDQKILANGTGNTLTLRGDVLPVPRPQLLSLIKYSLPDVLVTGDQSITDALDCCSNKNIWYQTVPWKANFAKALAKELPHKYLSKMSTACGTMQAINWKSDFSSFKNKHDFRKKAKKRLEAIFRAASEARRSGTLINRYLKTLESTRNKKKLLQVL